MLKVSHISDIVIYSTDWDAARLGKFTSSRWHCMMGDKPLTEGATTYIYHKVGEELTGKSTAEDETIEDENTEWGNTYEPDAIRKFGQLKNLEFLVTQRLISEPGSRFSSTPDALWVHGASVLKQDEYNVSTLEVKCPRKFHKFIRYFKCTTPAQLKALNKIYYWQVVDQMYNCDSAKGYFMAFHPLFPEGKNYRIIEFNKIELWDDFKLMAQRKKLAVEEFEATRKLFLDV